MKIDKKFLIAFSLNPPPPPPSLRSRFRRINEYPGLARDFSIPQEPVSCTRVDENMNGIVEYLE